MSEHFLSNQAAPGDTQPVDPLFAGLPEDGGQPEFCGLLAEFTRHEERPAAQVRHVPAVIADVATAAATIGRLAVNCYHQRRVGAQTVEQLRASMCISMIGARSLVATLPGLTPVEQIQAAVANLSVTLLAEDYLQRQVAAGAGSDFREQTRQVRHAQSQWALMGMQFESLYPRPARTTYALAVDLVAMAPADRRHHYPALRNIFEVLLHHVSETQVVQVSTAADETVE